MTDDFPILEKLAVVPQKIRKRRRHFVKVPWTWVEQLEGASGQVYRVALCLLYLHWKEDSAPVKLSNVILQIDGVGRQTKWRALRVLEQRGLIVVDRHPGRSPLVRLLR
jgi:hypothetical protein